MGETLRQIIGDRSPVTAQSDSSSRSRQQSEVMENRAEDVSEGRRTRNFDYAEIGPSRLNVTSCAGAEYCSVKNTGTRDGKHSFCSQTSIFESNGAKPEKYY
ncbi:uncharacterized protein LOC132207298 isoform X2 [Stegostoma tigrinum]|uniref:uncharacterized protein LOC132207298 isoform X2 n=1 Tax=Stegostoma tigrinum TaxID=3053191 RepID=UPI00286FB353|nr:uncharacterized protein LOC132207298 isoform X2 [Stegostoma tigrinum]XP_059498488.1 uncharacterized protein LOC132207298 isoform X2 [Stegostoma tigrinum]